MTLREAVVKVTPRNVATSWNKSIQESHRSHLLDKDFYSIHPREIMKLKEDVCGIGPGLIDRLLKLRFGETER